MRDFGDSELNPVPLWFQAPREAIDHVLGASYCDLGPDFLCFEHFYHAVSKTWPHEYRVFDIGGFSGLQGWLFDNFAYYLNVDRVGFNVRSPLPDDFCHIMADGCDFLLEYEAEVGFGEHDLFICSAVPDKSVREAVKRAPNHVIWYPGEEMDTSGPFGEATKRYFDALRRSDWRERADKAIFTLLDNENEAFCRARQALLV